MGMVQQIKDKYMKLQIWRDSGNYPVYSYVRIIYMEWVPQMKELPTIQTFIQEEILFQVLNAMVKMF